MSDKPRSWELFFSGLAAGTAHIRDPLKYKHDDDEYVHVIEAAPTLARIAELEKEKAECSGRNVWLALENADLRECVRQAERTIPNQIRQITRLRAQLEKCREQRNALGRELAKTADSEVVKSWDTCGLREQFDAEIEAIE